MPVKKGVMKPLTKDEEKVYTAQANKFGNVIVCKGTQERSSYTIKKTFKGLGAWKKAKEWQESYLVKVAREKEAAIKSKANGEMDDLDGLWQRDGNIACTVTGSVLRWPNGTETTISRQGNQVFIMFHGSQHTGEVLKGAWLVPARSARPASPQLVPAEIHWNDGDVWKRLTTVKDEDKVYTAQVSKSGNIILCKGTQERSSYTIFQTFKGAGAWIKAMEWKLSNKGQVKA